MKAVSPRSEIAWPVQSSRKSRLLNACRNRARDDPVAIASMAESYPAPVSDLLRVACVQMTSGPDKAANLESAERLVARAAATGADVVALPEKWNAIGSNEVLHAAAESLEAGESVAAMADWARASRDHARGRVDLRAARRAREALEHEPRLRARRRVARRLPQDPPLRRRGRRSRLPRVGGGGTRRRARGRARRRLADRADRLLRRPLPGALSNPRAGRRGARDGAGAFHDADGQGPLARAPARAGDREPVLRGRAGAGRRDAAGEARATAAR